MTWRAFVKSNVFGLGHTLYLGREDLGRGLEMAVGLEMRSYDNAYSIQDKDFLLQEGVMNQHDVRGFLQAMSDAAWEIGIKPKQIEDSRNELKAVREHLADMRMLAQEKLVINKPEGI